jgi:hypothetical protein
LYNFHLAYTDYHCVLLVLCVLRDNHLFDIDSECLVNTKWIAILAVEEEVLLRFGSLMVIYYWLRTSTACVDFLVICLGFAGVGVRYPPPGMLPFDALLEWLALKL